MSQTPPPIPTPTLAYATPIQTAAAGGIWRSGKTLIVGRDVYLPPTCIRCNEPGQKTYNRKAYWHPQILYLLILFPGLLIYAIVALCVRKKASYTCTLCDRHAGERMRNILITWGIVLAMVAAFVIAIMAGNDAFGRQNEWLIGVGILAGFLLLIGALIYGLVTVPLLRPKKIDDQYAHYSGAGEPFLAPLNSV